MEVSLVTSIIGGLGEYSLGSGAYNLLRPVAGKFALVTVPLARAVCSGVSQLFKQKSDLQEALDSAFIGFSDGLSQALDMAFGRASGVGCTLAGSMGNFFSEGAREFTQSHDLRSTVEVGIRGLLLGMGLFGALGILGVFTHLGKPLVKAPSIFNSESGFDLSRIQERLAAHRLWVADQIRRLGGDETDHQLVERLLENTRYISEPRFEAGLKEMGGAIDRFVGDKSYGLVYHGGSSQSGEFVTSKLLSFLPKPPAFIEPLNMTTRRQGRLLESAGDTQVWIDDGIYTGAQNLDDLEDSGLNPEKVLIATVAMSERALELIDRHRLARQAFSIYDIPSVGDIFNPREIDRLADIYNLSSTDRLPINFPGKFLFFFDHRMPDGFPYFLKGSPPLAGEVDDPRKIFNPWDYAYAWMR